MTPATTTQLDELDVVELRQRSGDYDEGTRGTVVSADPHGSKVTVEFEDSAGDVDLVTLDRLDLVLVQRAAKAARGWLPWSNGR
jgi:hypothetical protein